MRSLKDMHWPTSAKEWTTGLAKEWAIGLAFVVGATVVMIALIHGVDALRSYDLTPGGVALLPLLLYLVPSIIAYQRRTAVRGIIVVINLLLGWTVLGWIIALAMAFGPVEREADEGR